LKHTQVAQTDVKSLLMRCQVAKVPRRHLEKNGGQRWSLSAIHGLCDTGASLHNGIEPPTRGFSEAAINFKM